LCKSKIRKSAAYRICPCVGGEKIIQKMGHRKTALAESDRLGKGTTEYRRSKDSGRIKGSGNDRTCQESRF